MIVKCNDTITILPSESVPLSEGERNAHECDPIGSSREGGARGEEPRRCEWNVPERDLWGAVGISGTRANGEASICGARVFRAR